MIFFKKQVLSIFILLFLSHSNVNATQKIVLKSNMTESYKVLPKDVNTFSEMFTEGVVYGRLRFNSFGFAWDKELEVNDKSTRKDHAIASAGGSLLYKSAYLNGFAFTTGLYFTQAYGNLDDSEAYLYKAGKGVISRGDMLKDGSSNILSLAQAYLEYRNEETSIKVGRLKFESFLTAGNDTKMIPNTFEGVTLESKALPQLELKAAYLTKQKLRDHSEFHNLLARGDKLTEDVLNIYSENDDSAMHFGLTESRLDAAGIDDRLLIAEGTYRGISDLTVRMNYTMLPDLVASAMFQADYYLHIGELSLTPALRVMQQFDNGAGVIGGANLRTITEGYSDPDSLDSWLLGLRLDVAQDAWKLRFGYTQIADEGDLIAPWRGFPTGGFTRAMAQYNWYANTKTYMIRADYDFEKAGITPKLKGFIRFVIQDFDDSKQGVQADSSVLTLDLLKEFESIPNLYMKLRMAHVWGDALDNGNIKKLNPSYDEIRVELNYLF